MALGESVRMQSQLEVTYVREARALRLKGELDMASIGTLTAPLAHAVAAGGPIVVELTELRFMDSTGLHALLGTAQELSQKGWCLYLHTDDGMVRNLLELVGLDQFPNIHLIAHPGFGQHFVADGPPS